MITVDESLMQNMPFEYPKYNSKTFEKFFFEEFVKNQIEVDRIYLPIFWTSIYVARNFGNGNFSDIQEIIDRLPRDKKYFTIVQYDDNIINNLKDLDILIFSMGGYGKYKDKCYVIPLNCIGPNSETYTEKEFFATFCGRKTHKIRDELFSKLAKYQDYLLTESTEYEIFSKIMSKSIFSLCPRGYGLTSFRICESLRLGSIPVYIYDEPFIPFADIVDFNTYGVLIHHSELDNIDKKLRSFTNSDIYKMLENGKQVYINFYEYRGCFKSIMQILKKYEN